MVKGVLKALHRTIGLLGVALAFAPLKIVSYPWVSRKQIFVLNETPWLLQRVDRSLLKDGVLPRNPALLLPQTHLRMFNLAWKSSIGCYAILLPKESMARWVSVGCTVLVMVAPLLLTVQPLEIH